MVDVATPHLNAVLRNLGQDLVARGNQPTLESIADIALSGTSDKEAILIRSEVDKIIAKYLSDADLVWWWENSPSEVYFYRPGDVRSFLEVIAKRLEVLALG